MKHVCNSLPLRGHGPCVEPGVRPWPAAVLFALAILGLLALGALLLVAADVLVGLLSGLVVVAAAVALWRMLRGTRP